MESWHCHGGRAPQNNSNLLLQVADMIRASGGRIRRVIALGIITFEIHTHAVCVVHGSKFDLDRQQNTRWLEVLKGYLSSVSP